MSGITTSNYFISSFTQYELTYPTLPAISYTFGQSFGAFAVTKAAQSAKLGFLSVLSAYSVASFTNEVGLSAPFTASTVGAAGVTLQVTDSNSSTTVANTAGGSRYDTTGSSIPAFVTSTGSVTFTPVYSSAMQVYVGEDAAPSNLVVATNPPAIARANFVAALDPAIIVPGATYAGGFESVSGASPVLNIPNFYNAGTGGVAAGALSCTVTGGVVSTGVTGGMFATGGTHYYKVVSGTDAVFTFNLGVSAFGFYASNVSGAVTVYALPDDGTAEVSFSAKAATATNNLFFYGFVDPTKRYTRIRLVTAAGYNYAIDDVLAADQMTVLNPNPIKAFGLYLTDAGTLATTYSASIVTSAGTVNTTLPITQAQASGGLTFWGFTLNNDAILTSVTISSSNSADVPGFDDVIIGAPYLSA